MPSSGGFRGKKKPLWIGKAAEKRHGPVMNTISYESEARWCKRTIGVSSFEIKTPPLRPHLSKVLLTGVGEERFRSISADQDIDCSPYTRDVIAYSTLIFISLALASSLFGSLTSKIPFLKEALTLSACTSCGSSTDRKKAP
jgi:hypothetical protein